MKSRSHPIRRTTHPLLPRAPAARLPRQRTTVQAHLPATVRSLARAVAQLSSSRSLGPVAAATPLAAGLGNANAASGAQPILALLPAPTSAADEVAASTLTDC